MQTKTACLIRRISDKQYIGRGYSEFVGSREYTKSEFSAMRFHDIGDASEWLLNSVHAPKNTDWFEYVQVKITIEEMEE